MLSVSSVVGFAQKPDQKNAAPATTAAPAGAGTSHVAPTEDKREALNKRLEERKVVLKEKAEHTKSQPVHPAANADQKRDKK